MTGAARARRADRANRGAMAWLCGFSVAPTTLNPHSRRGDGILSGSVGRGGQPGGLPGRLVPPGELPITYDSAHDVRKG